VRAYSAPSTQWKMLNPSTFSLMSLRGLLGRMLEMWKTPTSQVEPRSMDNC
jgi:hypothetical protein